MLSFDTSGLDLSMAEEFDKIDDIRSYLTCKYGLDFAEKVMELVPIYLPEDFNII